MPSRQDPKEKLKSAVLEYIKRQQERQDLQILERNHPNQQYERSYVVNERNYIKEMEEESYLDNLQGRNYLKQFLGRDQADFATPVQKFISGKYPFHMKRN